MKQAIKDFLYKEIKPMNRGTIISLVIFWSAGLFFIGYCLGIIEGRDSATQIAIKQGADLIYESYIKVPK